MSNSIKQNIKFQILISKFQKTDFRQIKLIEILKIGAGFILGFIISV